MKTNEGNIIDIGFRNNETVILLEKNKKCYCVIYGATIKGKEIKDIHTIAYYPNHLSAKKDFINLISNKKINLKQQIQVQSFIAKRK